MERTAAIKPPYHIPLLRDLASGKDGLVAVSTFSGCGGSSLGLRWAGFDVRWANEFIPSAAAAYRANHLGYVNCDDVRDLDAETILREANIDGAIDLLEGSPPCAAFSLCGRRQKAWGESKTYSDGAQQTTDDLVFQFARLVAELMPRAFVMENVPGLAVGAALGYFLRLLSQIRATGYVASARVLDAQWLGAPQARRRLFLVGFREQATAERFSWPAPLPYTYSIQEALRTLPPEDVSHVSIDRYAIGAEWARLREGEQSARYFNLVRTHRRRPCPTITQTAGSLSAAGVTHFAEPRKFTTAELKRLAGFPDDFHLPGSYRQQAERIGRAVPPPMMRAVATAVHAAIA